MIAIIGGGISGLSLAYHLKKKNIPFVVIERSSSLGGVCGSFKHEGFSFDLGAHYLFERSDYAVDFVKETLHVPLRRDERRSLCYLRNRYVHFPVQNNLRDMGILYRIETIFSVLFNRATAWGSKTYEEWLLNKFGFLASDFIIPNSEKKWNVPASMVDADAVSQKVYDCSIWNMIKGCFKSSHGAFNAKQGEKNAGLLYPEGGMSSIIDALVEEVKDNVICNVKVEAVNLERKRIRLSNSKVIRYDALVSTIPLQGFIKLNEDCDDYVRERAEDLKYNQMALFMIGVKGHLGNDILRNMPHFMHLGKDFCFQRVSFPSHFTNFSPDSVPTGFSSVMAEICFPKADKRYWEIESYRNRKCDEVIRDLVSAGIINDAEDVCFCKIVFVNPAYMLFDNQSSESVRYVKNYLYYNHVYLLGRFAEWKYLDADQCIVRASDLADKLFIEENVRNVYDEESDDIAIVRKAEDDVEIERAILNECLSIRRDKTIAYRNSWREHGVNGAAHNLIRKWNRLVKIMGDGSNNISLANVSIDDMLGEEGYRTTLIDMINYCLMFIHLIDEESTTIKNK